MSEVHVYGVVPASERARGAPAGARRIAHRRVAALVADVEPGELPAPRVLRAHWKVLEEAGSTATVLPVRFGTVMADDRAVVEKFLAPRHDALAAQLADLAGKVQLTVKGFYDEAALMRRVVRRSPAIARLRERVRGLPEAAAYYDNIELGRLVSAEVERERERDSDLVIGRLEPIALAVSREGAATVDSAVNAAFLVERDRLDEFSGAVGELGRELEGRVRLRYVGPLPPYSFTGEDETSGTGAWA
jgi:hypothetical protein